MNGCYEKFIRKGEEERIFDWKNEADIYQDLANCFARRYVHKNPNYRSCSYLGYTADGYIRYRFYMTNGDIYEFQVKEH